MYNLWNTFFLLFMILHDCKYTLISKIVLWPVCIFNYEEPRKLCSHHIYIIGTVICVFMYEMFCCMYVYMFVCVGRCQIYFYSFFLFTLSVIFYFSFFCVSSWVVCLITYWSTSLYKSLTLPMVRYSWCRKTHGSDNTFMIYMCCIFMWQ